MTVTLELQDILTAVYTRIADDPAGAAVRALLGVDGTAGGAASVIPATLLGRRPLPATPFVAFRGGAVGGAALEMRAVTAVWWAYDLPARGYARIHAILAAIEAAYPYTAIPHGRMRVGPIGPEADDRTLGGLLTRPLQISYTRRA